MMASDLHSSCPLSVLCMPHTLLLCCLLCSCPCLSVARTVDDFQRMWKRKAALRALKVGLKWDWLPVVVVAIRPL